MRALVLRDFWDFRVDERDSPHPGPGEVAVRVAATGICGTDLHGYTGDNGRRRAGQVMGHETVGHVLDAGAGVRDVVPGTVATVNPVIACGRCAACGRGQEQACAAKSVIGVTPDYVSAFAEVFVAPAANVVRLPDDMPLAYGALVEPLAVAYHAACRGGVTADDSVLVLGGGPIGQSAVLGCQRLGARTVVVSEPDPARRELCSGLGAGTVDPGDGELPSRVEAALGERPSVALDAVGISATVADACACSRFGARVVLVGMHSPRLDIPAYAVSTEERALIGSFCYTARHFREVAEWVATAPPVLDTLIETTVDVTEAPATFAAMARGTRPQAGKVLVTFAGDA